METLNLIPSELNARIETVESQLSKQEEQLRLFLDFSTQYGSHYLSCGGPTSRLEDKLIKFGEILGYPTEVFATTTGLFVSARLSPYSDTRTVLGRIKTGTQDLAELVRLEKLLSRLAKNEITIAEAFELLKANPDDQISNALVLFAVFVFGVSTSLPQFGNWWAAITSGILSPLVFWLSGPIAKKLKLQGVFSEFIGACLAFCIAGVLATFTGWRPESMIMGTLIIMVPGLTFTNAISELAEHNFLSGTSKMMRGLLTLTAMGCSYLLVRDLDILMHGKALVFDRTPLPNVPVSLQVVGIIGSLTSVSIIFNVPIRLIPYSMITGLLSWVLLFWFKDKNFIMLSGFATAFAVGIFSYGFSKKLKVPSQVFSVPGILALVPGMLALSFFYTMDNTDEIIFGRVLVIASSIVFGLFTARIPYILLKPNDSVIAEHD